MSDELYGTAHPEYMQQLEYEIDMIEKMGFTDYFLIVWDLVRLAKSAGIPVRPRTRQRSRLGPVTYCLHITEIDPMKYGLYFERFLNPARVTMPDIDMDFGDTRRSEVVDYVRQKYGEDHVAQIVTFGTMASQSRHSRRGPCHELHVCRDGRRREASCRRRFISHSRTHLEPIPAAEADVRRRCAR